MDLGRKNNPRFFRVDSKDENHPKPDIAHSNPALKTIREMPWKSPLTFSSVNY